MSKKTFIALLSALYKFLVMNISESIRLAFTRYNQQSLIVGLNKHQFADQSQLFSAIKSWFFNSANIPKNLTKNILPLK